MDPSFDPKTIDAGNNIVLWEQHVAYMNVLIYRNLKIYCFITIWDFMGNANQLHLIWKNLVKYYKSPPFSCNHAAVYSVVLYEL